MQEIGIVVYPGSQQAAILGLTDLFAVANRVAATHTETEVPALKVTHWRYGAAEAAPQKEFDSYAAMASNTLAALILPPALGEPLMPDDMPALLTWLRERHTEGVVLIGMCRGVCVSGDGFDGQ